MTPSAHPADVDTARLSTLVRELLVSFPDPTTGRALPGLLAQAWTPSLAMLMARQTDDVGSSGKPGSRPPMRLDLEAHVMTCLDVARELADDLGLYTNSADGELALRRLPALVEPTYGDCRVCDRCVRDDGACDCRHRQVCHAIDVCHSTLRTALNWQPPRLDWTRARCPQCEQTGWLSVRGDRIWCRRGGCRYDRTGTFAVLALA